MKHIIKNLNFATFQQPYLETPTQVFSCEFGEISKNIFFTKHLWATAAEVLKRSFFVSKLFTEMSAIFCLPVVIVELMEILLLTFKYGINSHLSLVTYITPNFNIIHVKTMWSNYVNLRHVAKALDSQSRGALFKTTGWLRGRLSLSSF